MVFKKKDREVINLGPAPTKKMFIRLFLVKLRSHYNKSWSFLAVFLMKKKLLLSEERTRYEVKDTLRRSKLF